MKMNKFNTIGLSTILLFSISATCSAQSTVIGKLDGLGQDDLIFYYRYAGKTKRDTVKVKEGSFTWTAAIEEPAYAMVYLPLNGKKQKLDFYIAPGEQSLIGSVANADAFDRIRLKGSRTNDEYAAFSKSADSLYNLYSEVNSRAKTLSGEEKQAAEKEAAQLLFKTTRGLATDFITSHPDSYLSLDLLKNVGAGMRSVMVKQYFDALEKPLKQTFAGKLMADQLNAASRGNVGKTMANFELSDINGKTIKLSDYKSKYVLVDFWASWCAPCRTENPNLLKTYNSFSQKGFEIISISIDTMLDKWKKAVSDDKLPWVQLLDVTDLNKDRVIDYYGITAIPANFLIDPNGKIIARDLRGSALSERLKQEGI